MTATLSWTDIEAITGGELGRFDAACPVCGPDRLTPARGRRPVLRVWRDEPDFAGYTCIRCSLKGAVRPDAEAPQRGILWRSLCEPPASNAAFARREAEARADRLRRIGFAEFVFHAAGDITGTPAEAYLRSRGVPSGHDLRFTPFAPHSYAGDRHSPAMIAAVRDVAGAVIGAQATLLSPEGAKVRRTTFGVVGGGAVRLAPIGPDGSLAVAEGVETALSFTRLFEIPCWAALSVVGIEQFVLPAGLKRLVIAADSDASGRGLKAAQTLAKRACLDTEVVISPPKAGDWNDVLQGQHAEASA